MILQKSTLYDYCQLDEKDNTITLEGDQYRKCIMYCINVVLCCATHQWRMKYEIIKLSHTVYGFEFKIIIILKFSFVLSKPIIP